MLSTIRTEKALKARLRTIARDALDRNVSEAEVQTWANEVYERPTPRFPHKSPLRTARAQGPATVATQETVLSNRTNLEGLQ